MSEESPVTVQPGVPEVVAPFQSLSIQPPVVVEPQVAVPVPVPPISQNQQPVLQPPVDNNNTTEKVSVPQPSVVPSVVVPNDIPKTLTQPPTEVSQPPSKVKLIIIILEYQIIIILEFFGTKMRPLLVP